MTSTIQRPFRGSRISSFYPVKSLPSLSSLDSAFQLQEYISLLIRLDVHDVEAITSLPGASGHPKEGSADEKEREREGSLKGKEREDGGKDGDAEAAEKEREREEKAKGGEVSVDEACWIYEQLRRLAQDLSHPLITTLQQECTRASCPEMKAGEWLYLCVAHGNDGAMEQCCAIDYILHTVDSATALLNSPRTFPSRLSIPQTSHRHFSSLARRLGRIFAHAYFHHREAFEQAEAESSLYARFLALTSKFDLVPAEFLVIPPLASGSSSAGGGGSATSDEDDIGRGFVHLELGGQGGGGRRYPAGIPRPLSDSSGLGQGQAPGLLQQKYLQLHHAQHLAQHPHSPSHGQLGSYSPRGSGVGRGLQSERTLTSASFGVTSPNALSGSGSGSSSPSAGSGPSPSPGPSPGTRSRFGRNRTDTMVFADAEASAVADELAAKARAGELEPEPVPAPLRFGSRERQAADRERQEREEQEREGLKTARPSGRELEPEVLPAAEAPEVVEGEQPAPAPKSEPETKTEPHSYAEAVKASESEPQPEPQPQAQAQAQPQEAEKRDKDVKEEAEKVEAEAEAEAAEEFEISLSPNEEIPSSSPVVVDAAAAAGVETIPTHREEEGKPKAPTQAEAEPEPSAPTPHTEDGMTHELEHNLIDLGADPSTLLGAEPAPSAEPQPQSAPEPEPEADKPIQSEPEEVKSEDPLLSLSLGGVVQATSTEEVEALLVPLSRAQPADDDDEDKHGEDKDKDATSETSESEVPLASLEEASAPAAAAEAAAEGEGEAGGKAGGKEEEGEGEGAEEGVGAEEAVEEAAKEVDLEVEMASASATGAGAGAVETGTAEGEVQLEEASA